MGTGLAFVSLAALTNPALVLSTLARTLGLRKAKGLLLLESLQAYLQHRRLLLVLDNFEQVLPAAPQIAALLGTTSDVGVLVTSSGTAPYSRRT